jgi:hypothetical protein
MLQSGTTRALRAHYWKKERRIMIAQKNIEELMPVEKAPSPVAERSDTAKNQPQQKKKAMTAI